MRKYKCWEKPIKQENGTILINVLIFIALISLTLIPVLNYINTGYKSGQLFQEKADDFYAADAGIEDAKWQIKNEGLSIIYPSPNYYNQFNFGEPTWGINADGKYKPTDGGQLSEINGRNVTVQIKNVWVPYGISIPSASDAQNIIQSARLVVAGRDNGITYETKARQFEIKVSYYPHVGENLYVTTLGVWLPPGFEYYTDSSQGLQINGQDFTAVALASYSSASGTALVWTLNTSTLFRNMPGVSSSDNPMVLTVTFWQNQYAKIMPGIGWLTTSGVSSIPYSWDSGTHLMQINSQATKTSIDALMIHQEARQLGGSINGDYYATGNSLMTPTGSATSNRDRLYGSSTAVVSTTSDPLLGIPTSAEIEAVYLYWQGYIDWHGYNPLGASPTTIIPPDVESGVSFTDAYGPNWPTFGNKWSANFTYPTSGSNKVFKAINTTTGIGDPNGTLASGTIDLSEYNNRTVVLNWKQARGSTTLTSSDKLYCQISNDGTNWVTIATINGNTITTTLTATTGITIANNYLTPTCRIRFCTTLSSTSGKTIYLDDIKFEYQPIFFDDCSTLAKWTQSGTTTWTVSSGQFHGIGGGTLANSYLKMVNVINLSSYYGVSLAVSWDNISDTLGSTDELYFSFAPDGNLANPTWCTEIPAFDATSISGYTSFLIPDIYKTANFKMRFRIASGSSSRYVNIDNIAISGPTLKYPSNETSGSISDLVENVAKVNQVRFGTTTDNTITIKTTDTDEMGHQLGTYQTVRATTTSSTNDWYDTWFYESMYDVTGIVKGWIGNGGAGPNGAASYTLGHVVANNTEDPNYKKTLYPSGVTTGYPLGSPALDQTSDRFQRSYAGWSLVFIYSSPVTKGHQLWLYDLMNEDFHFVEGWGQTIPNPDFDGDGLPGGFISGFLVPAGIVDETNSSKITVFVGEGDSGITGDYFKVNNKSLDDGAGYGTNNVWNSHSRGLTIPGIDIDTFYINYLAPDGSILLAPGSTSAQIDMPTVEGFLLGYIIISFRSDAITGGAITYLIR